MHVKAVAAESVKIVSHVNEVHSTSAKEQIDPSLSDFGQTDIFVTGHQSAPESEKLILVNNSCELNSQGYGTPSVSHYVLCI